MKHIKEIDPRQQPNDWFTLPAHRANDLFYYAVIMMERHDPAILDQFIQENPPRTDQETEYYRIVRNMVARYRRLNVPAVHDDALDEIETGDEDAPWWDNYAGGEQPPVTYCAAFALPGEY